MRTSCRCVERMRFYSLLLLLLPAFAEKNSFDQDTYGFDVSWAIRTPHLSSEMGDKQGLYDDFMHKCRAAAGEEKAPYACDAGEEYRLKMNTYQPMSMRNYTKMGFKKIRAPEETFKILKDFWDTNRNKNQTEWKSLNTYHNLWDSPSAIVDIQQPSFGGGPHVTTQVWESARQTLEEWTGMHLSPCSIWGIRIYKNNSILTTHVDRNPLVTSAIINVDQDVDEPWPLEVWGHDGKPYNVTMEPGDMVLYESHSVLHGRPFPLKGRFFANIFVHFEPLGIYRKDADDFTVDSIQYDKLALESLDHDLPPYVIPGSPWEEEWKEKHEDGWELLNSDIRRGIQDGNMRVVDNLFIQDPESIHEPDKNGWTPLHEAVRAGRANVVKYLLDRGVDINVRTGFGRGESAMQMAKKYHGTESAVYQLLEGVGAEM